MWHEARKQEKKIRGMLVDYKRRAERRREYYEKIKQDPTQFIQIHGRSCKIHLDPAVHYAAEAPGSMMPWRGDRESMIDRFDVRAHLDDIPPFNHNFSLILSPEEQWEERQANYERYRILVQNEFLGVKEEKFLNQIRLEELYGPVGGNRAIEEEKKALIPKKAAIGFNYDETPIADNTQINWPPLPMDDPEDSGDDSDSDIDLDLTVDVLSLTNEQQMEMNTSGVEYGLNKGDFMALISRDLEEAEALRVAKEHEDEKAMFSIKMEDFEGFAKSQRNLSVGNEDNRSCTSPNYDNKLEDYDLHEKCVIHRKCISRSSLSYTPDNCDTCQSLLTDQEGQFVTKIFNLISAWRKVNGQEEVVDMRERCVQRNYKIPLLSDKELAETLKKSGRKSRKERRALKKKHLDKKMSPPSYAARASPTYSPHHGLSSHSKSKSASPPCGASQIKFITCFGEESDGAQSDGNGTSGVIIIPEPNKCSRSGHHHHADRKKEHRSTSSSLRRNRNRHRTSSSSRDRSRSTSRNQGHLSRQRYFSRSSSKRRSRSRSRRDGSRYGSNNSNRRSESYCQGATKKYRTYSRSRSRSSDRKKKNNWSHHYRSPKSRSYSRSRSRTKSSRSRSRSSTKRKESKFSNQLDSMTSSKDQEEGKGTSPPKLPSPPRRRYYGRRAENSDSDCDSGADEVGESLPTGPATKGSVAMFEQTTSSSNLYSQSTFGNEPSSDKTSSMGSKLTPKERLRKKMQALLKKQYKADKKLEKERAEKAEQERQDREDELREIAIKLRRREREKRHRLHGEDSGSDESNESRSSSRSPVSKSSRTRDRSSPPEREVERLPERARLDRNRRHTTDRDESGDRGKDKFEDSHKSEERNTFIRRHERDYSLPLKEDSHRGKERHSGRTREHSNDGNRHHSTSHGFSSTNSRGKHTDSFRETDKNLSDEENRGIRLVDY